MFVPDGSFNVSIAHLKPVFSVAAAGLEWQHDLKCWGHIVRQLTSSCKAKTVTLIPELLGATVTAIIDRATVLCFICQIFVLGDLNKSSVEMFGNRGRVIFYAKGSKRFHRQLSVFSASFVWESYSQQLQDTWVNFRSLYTAAHNLGAGKPILSQLQKVSLSRKALIFVWLLLESVCGLRAVIFGCPLLWSTISYPNCFHVAPVEWKEIQVSTIGRNWMDG